MGGRRAWHRRSGQPHKPTLSTPTNPPPFLLPNPNPFASLFLQLTRCHASSIQAIGFFGMEEMGVRQIISGLGMYTAHRSRERVAGRLRDQFFFGLRELSAKHAPQQQKPAGLLLRYLNVSTAKAPFSPRKPHFFFFSFSSPKCDEYPSPCFFEQSIFPRFHPRPFCVPPRDQSTAEVYPQKPSFWGRTS